MSNESIRVLVVEDHHVVRQGLVALLNVVDGLEVVAEAADGVEAIAQYRKHQPDIALIDLRLPRLSGEGYDNRRVDRNHPHCSRRQIAHPASDCAATGGAHGHRRTDAARVRCA